MTTIRSRGSIKELHTWIEAIEPRSVLVVKGGTSFKASGAGPHVLEALSNTVVESLIALPNPESSRISSWSESFRTSPPEAVVAVGGGSVIDTAKLVRHFGAAGSRPPLAAIPTTSGSGAEATHFAVMYNDGRKLSIADPSLLPDFVILDADLTDALPPPITASTGFDALSQAIESAWSVRSTEHSRIGALDAVALAASNLVSAVRSPNERNRDAMMKAANLAGTAINTTFTTAPHAISYTLTSSHGVPHGHAVAMTLGSMLVYNADVSTEDCVDPRGPEHVVSVIGSVCAALGVVSAHEARDWLADALTQTGLATSLTAIGAGTNEAIAAIAESVDVDRLSNNPRRIDRKSIVAILDSIR